MLLVLLFLSTFLFSTIKCGPVKVDTEPEKPLYRLPEYMISKKGLSYNLFLNLDDEFHTEQIYTGKVDIGFEIVVPLNSILIHFSQKLKKERVTLTSIWSFNPEPIKNLTAREDDLYEIFFNKELEVEEEYTLHIDFVGNFDNSSLNGLYLSKYNDTKAGEMLAVSTQFKPTYARTAFPCFDEPSYKATFRITIQHPTDYYALSNTEGRRDEVNDWYTQTSFEETAPMPTYLVAFVVSKFENKTATNETFKVHARKEQINFAEYSVTKTPELIDTLKDLLGNDPFEHEMQKVDQVAVPELAVNAIESWGLVTYRENVLLFDENNANERNRQDILTLIAHELSHFWFGNSVSLDWWSNTWLNEGFARYFEYYAAHIIEPTWELDKQCVIEQQQTAFIEDAFDHVEALSSDVYTPSEINSKFDTITYNKGASIVRMMLNFIDTDVKYLLKPYLQVNKDDTVNPDILFETIEKAMDKRNLPENKKLKDVMFNWFYKPGFPVLNVVKEKNGFKITQKQFKANPESSRLYEAPIWTVPLKYKTSKNNTSETNWLLEETITIPHNNAEWILLNLDAFGYYRVNYENALWTKISTELIKKDFGNIGDMHRSQLIDDIMNLARAKELKYETALDFLEFLKNEKSYYSWYSALQAFSFLQTRLDGNNLEDFNHFITDLMNNWYESILQKNSTVTHLEQLTHILAHEWACKLNNKKCVHMALILFGNGKQKVNANDRSYVYCTAVREDKNNFNTLLEKIQNNDPALPYSERLLILSALGCSKDKQQLNTYLSLTISKDNVIKKQDTNVVFNAVLDNPVGVDVAVNFLAQNSGKIKEYYGGFNAIYDISSKIANKLTTNDQLKKLEEFMTTEKVISTETILTKAKTNLNWAKYFKSDFEKFLSKKKTTKTNSASVLGINTVFLLVSTLLLKYLF